MSKEPLDDTFIWKRVTPANDAHKPSPRRYHAGVIHKRMFVTFGGSKASTEMLSDLHSFDLDTLTWTLRAPSGTIPEPRGGYSCCHVDNKLYVFGGISSSKQALSDLYSLDLDTLEWTAIARPSAAAVWPGPRYQHTAVAADGVMYIYGGAVDLKKYQPDAFSFNFETATWTRLDVQAASDASGGIPEHRAGHIAFIKDEFMYIYGGHTGDGGFTYLSDMHRLKLSTLRWSKVEYKGEGPFSARVVPSVQYRDLVFVFGGYDGATKAPQTALFSLDTLTLSWTKHDLWMDMSENLSLAAVGSKGTVPTPRYGHAIAFDPVSQSLYIHAGSGSMYLTDIFQIILPDSVTLAK